MNKIELINAVAEKAGMTKVDARKAVDAMMDVTKDELKKGGKIALVGLGTMGVTERPAREGRNPRTGKTIKIDAKKIVRFKPAKDILK
ncbi:MAG: HU family DNA-binding protein [Bacteroidales bacterium]|jgi:DNA-binding protein HU-beta|nr:HU family DNA-binding protein [Bacteroidales bacterium]